MKFGIENRAQPNKSLDARRNSDFLKNVVLNLELVADLCPLNVLSVLQNLDERAGAQLVRRQSRQPNGLML